MPLLGLQDHMASSMPIAALASAPAAVGAEMVCGPFGDAKDNFSVRQACAALERLIHIARKSDDQGAWSPPLELDFYTVAQKLYCDGLCQKECFILALIYGQRLFKKSSFGLMSAQNVYRFFIVSVMVASKFLDDHYCRNSYFASAGGMTTAELNALEVRFCFLMDFKLAVSTEEYEACLAALLADASLLPRMQPASVFSAPSVLVPALATNVSSSAMAGPTPVYPSLITMPPHVVGSCALPVYYAPAPPLWPCWDPAKIWMPLPVGAAAATSAAASVDRASLRFDPLGAASAWFAHCPTA